MALVLGFLQRAQARCLPLSRFCVQPQLQPPLLRGSRLFSSGPSPPKGSGGGGGSVPRPGPDGPWAPKQRASGHRPPGSWERRRHGGGEPQAPGAEGGVVSARASRPSNDARRTGTWIPRGRVDGGRGSTGGSQHHAQQRQQTPWRPRALQQRVVGAAAGRAAVPGDDAVIRITGGTTARDLANRIAVRLVDVLKSLIKLGENPMTADHPMTADMCELVCMDLGRKYVRVEGAVDRTMDQFPRPTPKDVSGFPLRPPVVAVMGHVDHGKTTLLDALRGTTVAQREAGGITQHMAAFSVPTSDGRTITFIDTPGHAAFSAMRARGANVTDIVALVVAADDGVMPQTVEAIKHAQLSNATILVAINKCDRPGANPARVRKQLLQHGVVTEQHGGQTLSAEISALQRKGLDHFLSALQLQAEMLSLHADDSGPAEGTVIETRILRGYGSVLSVLMQRGTLRPDDCVVAGLSWGKVKALINDKGEEVPAAGPGLPVQVAGLKVAPVIGSTMLAVPTEERAKAVASYRETRERARAGAAVLGAPAAAGTGGGSSAEPSAEPTKRVPIILRTDVGGTAEAILSELARLPRDEVAAQIVSAGVGNITEGDIATAEQVGAIVVAFNAKASPGVQALARRANVTIKQHSIIYDLLDDIAAHMSALLPPSETQSVVGEAEVLQVFPLGGRTAGEPVAAIAGCRMLEGDLIKGSWIRVLREDAASLERRVVFEGEIASLRRFKDVVKAVSKGQECGVVLAGFSDFRQGDTLHRVLTTTQTRTLEVPKPQAPRA